MRRSVRLLLGLIATTAMLSVAGPVLAQDGPGVGLPLPTDGNGAEIIPCDEGPGGGDIAEICGATGEASVDVVETQVSVVEAAALTVWRQLIDWFASGLGLLLDGLVSAAEATTRIDFTATWFVEQFKGVLRIGGLVMLPLFLAAIIRGLLTDRAEIGRAVSRLPVAALLTAIALPAAQLFVATVDALSSGYEAALGSSVRELTTLLGAAAEPLVTPATVTGSGAQTIGAAAFGFLLAALFLIFTSFVVWLELVLRQAGLYLLVLFLPLAFAGLVWAPTRAWLGRMAQAFTALVVSKFVIVVVLSTAAAALRSMAADWVSVPVTASGELLPTASASELLSVLVLGVALIGLAAFAPYTVWRLIPIAAAQASTTFEGVLRRPTAAVGRPHAMQATYNRVGQMARGGGAASTARPADPSPRPAVGPPAASVGAAASSSSAASPVAAAAAVASKATATARSKVTRLPDRGAAAG